ncbi:MAG: hypothetical protein ACREJC_00395, partial [Tepidisphaeraceae bacterium]
MTANIDLKALHAQARTDEHARGVLADLHEVRGETAIADLLRCKIYGPSFVNGLHRTERTEVKEVDGYSVCG